MYYKRVKNWIITSKRKEYKQKYITAAFSAWGIYKHVLPTAKMFFGTLFFWNIYWNHPLLDRRLPKKLHTHTLQIPRTDAGEQWKWRRIRIESRTNMHTKLSAPRHVCLHWSFRKVTHFKWHYVYLSEVLTWRVYKEVRGDYLLYIYIYI